MGKIIFRNQEWKYNCIWHEAALILWYENSVFNQWSSYGLKCCGIKS
jgi:hypothetical protein